MVAARENGDELAAIGPVDQRLDKFFARQLEILGHFGDAFLSRRGNFFQLGRHFGDVAPGGASGFDFRLFHVGGIIAGIAAYDGVFAGLREHLKFMGLTSSDRAGVRFNGAKAQTATAEDPLIGLVHVVVFPAAVFDIRVKTVSVLHDEFATAHQAEAGPWFVAKFCLNLIKIERQLAIGAHGTAHQIGDDFFVGRTETEVALIAIFETQELFTVHLPSAALLPKFRRRRDRHEQLLGARPVHFLADNLLDLANDAQRQRKVVIDAAAHLPNKAGTDQKLVADDFGVSRIFFERGYEDFAPTHNCCLTIRKIDCGLRTV